MLAHLPGPMLSIAVDQVLKVHSEDALGGLWNVFTKCKDSLADGRRLENISWRLWYRHMASMNDENHLATTPPLEHSVSDSEEEENWEDETTVGDDEVASPQPEPSTPVVIRPSRSRPGRPISRSASPVRSRTALPPLASSHPSSSRRPTLANVRSYSSSPGRGPINVGKFISDLLPERAIPERPRRVAEATPGASSSSGPASSRAPASQSPPHEKPASTDDRTQQSFQRGRGMGHGTTDSIAKADRPPAMILTNPTPRPTPQPTPGIEAEATSPSPSARLRPSDTALSRRRMFEFVPLQEPVQSERALANDALSQARQEKDEEAPRAPRQKIFYIASTPNDHGSSYSDSPSPHSEPRPPPQPQPPPDPVPTAGPVEPAMDDRSPESRPTMPPRTRSKRQLPTLAARPGAAAKHVTAKYRAGVVRPAAQPPVAARYSGERTRVASQVDLVGERRRVRPTSAPVPALVASQEPEATVPATAQKPVVPPGVGSPLLTRRKEAEPAVAPAHGPAAAPAAIAQVPAGPSSSPAVLRAPPPTPASILGRVLREGESPEVLRAPPPTPVGPNGAVLPTGARTQRRSPPPPAPSSLEDDSDESDWYDSDAESYEGPSKEPMEDVRAREFRQAAEEVQRQQQMFIKRRTPSRVELAEQARASGGLTKLFHPEPAVIDMIHLYRTKSAEGAAPGPGPSSMAERLKAHHSSVDLRHRGIPSALKMSKSTVALPTLQNESVGARTHWMGKRPPEAEDETEDEADAEEPDLGMSRSMAQKRLEAFVSRASSNKSHHLPAPVEPPGVPIGGPELTAALHNASPRRAPSSSGSNGSQQHAHFAPEPARPASVVEPIPLPPHPYNLPPVDELTPRTQARRMMEDELSESMRRQLVWLRASKKRLLGGEHRLPRTRSEEDVFAQAPEPPSAYSNNRVPRARGSAPSMGAGPGASGTEGPSASGVPTAPAVAGVPDILRRHSVIRPLTPMQQPTHITHLPLLAQPQVNVPIDPRVEGLQSEPVNPRKTTAAMKRTHSLAQGLAHADYHIAGW